MNIDQNFTQDTGEQGDFFVVTSNIIEPPLKCPHL